MGRYGQEEGRGYHDVTWAKYLANFIINLRRYDIPLREIIPPQELAGLLALAHAGRITQGDIRREIAARHARNKQDAREGDEKAGE